MINHIKNTGSTVTVAESPGDGRMMTGQRTFELIPTSLVKSAGQRRPMTSKAAKKAYQQANRGPKISRAEQHRRDNAELEQQKKEYEKERAAARAKAAREKKAAKADAEKAARRKQGLPEPSRFVRPSQPTISRFVRSDNTNKRTWQQMESVAENADQAMSDTEQNNRRPPAKRQSVEEGSDDEFGDFPALSQLDLLEKVGSSVSLVKKGSIPRSSGKLRASSQSRRYGTSQQLPKMKEADEDSISNTQALDDMVTTELLSDLVKAVTKSDSLEPPERGLSQRRKNTAQMPLMSQPSPRRSGRVAEMVGKSQEMSSSPRRSTIPVVEIPAKSAETMRLLNETSSSLRNTVLKTPAVLQKRSTDMPPPRLPSKVFMASYCIPTPQKPDFPKNTLLKNVTKPSPCPPSSTQAFLESHMDDFFPSPTQAVRELLDDLDDIPSNTQVARELSPEKPEKSCIETMFSTQDFILTPEDLVEIVSPYCSPRGLLKKATSDSFNRQEHAQVPKKSTPEKAKCTIENIKSTQDLVPSPIDPKEINPPHVTPQKSLQETTSKTPNSTNNMDGRKSIPEKTKIDVDDFMSSQELVFSPVDLEETISPHRAPPKPLQEVTSESLNREKSPRGAKQTGYEEMRNDLDDFMDMQDIVFSPVDLEEIISPRRTLAKPLKEATSELTNRRKQDHGVEKPAKQKNDLDEFMSTQDLILSPGDLAEIYSSPRQAPPLSPPKRKPSSSNHRGNLQSHRPAQPKRRFFEEKDEDLFHAAIQESKATAAQAPAPKPQSDTILSPNRNRNQSDSTDYGDFDFDLPGLFKDKEDEELEAAIRESKITAEREAERLAALEVVGREEVEELSRVLSNSTDYGDFDVPGLFEERNEAASHSTDAKNEQLNPHSRDIATTGTNTTKAKPRRFFEEKYEDQVHAAIHESKMLAATKISIGGREVASPTRFFKEKYEDQVVAALHESRMLAAGKKGVEKEMEVGGKEMGKKEPESREKRKMTRILSTATDYGDDDFMDCELELAGMC